MGLIASIFGCKKDNVTAEIEMWTEFTNTMEYIPPEERTEEPEPVHETYTVKKGDKVRNGMLLIKEVAEDSITVELNTEYVGGVYGADGHMKTYYSDPATVFTIGKGEELSVTEYGLMDADFSVCVILKEITQQGR